MKYVRRDYLLEAEQYRVGETDPFAHLGIQAPVTTDFSYKLKSLTDQYPRYIVDTHGNRVTLKHGDWVIRSFPTYGRGAFSVWPDETFRQTFTKVFMPCDGDHGEPPCAHVECWHR